MGTSFANPNLAPEPVSGDSLTQYLRSLTNFAGTAAPGFLQAGQGVFGAGVGTVGTGLQTMQPSIDYWNKILSGDPTALTTATAPYANMLSNVYAGATNTAGQGLPAGGFRSTTLAQLPFAQSSQVGNFLMNLQPQAAQSLLGAGSTQGQIGLGLGQLGMSETGVGTNLLQLALQSLLTRRGQNVQQDIGNLNAFVGGMNGLMSAASNAYSANQQGTSDVRLKEGIIPLGQINGIPVYAFRFHDDPDATVRFGVMAQEVYQVYPDVVIVGGDDPERMPWRVDYQKLFERIGVN